jgi:putative heme iron utilization protein
MIKKIVNFFGNPENAGMQKKLGILTLVVVFVSDFFVHRDHALYIWDKIPGWGAFYGFVSCVIIILVSKFIGHQGGIMKREDYYND